MRQVITIQLESNKGHRIIVPETLRRRLVDWYHSILVHPGADQLYATLKKHFVWPKMREDIVKWTRPCDSCQRGKRGGKGYGKVPKKDVERGPWRDVCVDLAGPWKTKVNGKQTEIFALTLIDPFTSWVETVRIKGKPGEHIIDQIEQEWLYRYPRPERIIFDQGSEFDNQYMRRLCKKWNIKPEPITAKNPRANSIVERLHFTMGNKLRAQLASDHKHHDPIKEVLAAATYGVRAAVHSVTGFTPGELVFKRDMLFRTLVEADMELVKARRQKAIDRNNERENKRRLAHTYKKGDKVLILTSKLDPKLKLHQGPYEVLGYNKESGTLHISRRHYRDSINVRLVRPHFG